MVTFPPQSPPVFRDLQGRPPSEADGAEGVAAIQQLGGVHSSQTRCDHLVGPAQSMCYAALYGIRV
jgi:hypothetical protein